jgi:uncharacterized cupredoxin-like copper-binding protein
MDWSHPERVDVTLSNFKYQPKVIHLRAGQPIVLHLINASKGGHDFTARQFFSAAQIRPEDGPTVQEGSVEVGGHEIRDVVLVPRPGRYPVKCTHGLHTAFGMTGEILVE